MRLINSLQLCWSASIHFMRLTKIHKILLLSSSLWFLGEGLLGPLFAVFSEKIGGDILDITWAWSVYLVLSGLLYVFFGRVLRNSSYKQHAMLFGYFFNAILTFCYLLVTNTNQLFVLQIGFAIAEAISTPIWDALFASDLEKADDSLFWGIAGGHSHIITGVAVAIGGLITYYISFHALFLIMGIVQLLSAFVQLQLLRTNQNE